MTNFEQKFYAPWLNEMHEATNFHQNNRGFPVPGVPDTDKFIFTLSKLKVICVDAKCGKITVREEEVGEENKNMTVAECGNKLKKVMLKNLALHSTTTIQTQVTSSSQSLVVVGKGRGKNLKGDK